MNSTVNLRLLFFVLLFSTGLGNVFDRDISSNTLAFDIKNTSGTAMENEKQPPANNIITLKVALFPFIPDSAGDKYHYLLTGIRHHFRRDYPQYDVEFRQIDQNDKFYDMSQLTHWLTNNTHGYDIVEVDTVLLGDLVNANLIIPQDIPSRSLADFNPAAIKAVEFNSAYYGYPHLMCAFFLITYLAQVSDSTTIDELVQSLGPRPSEYQRIVGNLNSSWDLPALWLNSYHDTYVVGNGTVAPALHNYDFFKFESLQKLARLCDVEGRPNPCLDGTFKDPDKMADVFIRHQALALFGYSERLFRIINNSYPGAVNDIKVTPLPLGTLRNDPMFFTDAFVIRRHLPNDVQQAAKAFVQFMGSSVMQAIFVGGFDNPSLDRIPRYLLPVSKGAYEYDIIKKDPIYQQVFRHLYGPPYPNIGLYTARKELQNTILRNIK